MISRSNRRRREGFTLIEIAVTLSILGVILLVVYGIFSRTLAATQIAEARTEAEATVRGVFRWIARDVRSALYQVPRDPRELASDPEEETAVSAKKRRIEPLFISKDGTGSGLPLDEMTFTAMLRRPVSGTFPPVSAVDVATVRYALVPAPDAGEGHILFRETVFSLSGEEFDPEAAPAEPSLLALVEGVRALRFRFFDGYEWVEEWDSTGPHPPAPIPPAVEVTLSFASGDMPKEDFRMVVDIPYSPPTIRDREREGLPGPLSGDPDPLSRSAES